MFYNFSDESKKTDPNPIASTINELGTFPEGFFYI